MNRKGLVSDNMMITFFVLAIVVVGFSHRSESSAFFIKFDA